MEKRAAILTTHSRLVLIIVLLCHQVTLLLRLELCKYIMRRSSSKFPMLICNDVHLEMFLPILLCFVF